MERHLGQKKGAGNLFLSILDWCPLFDKIMIQFCASYCFYPYRRVIKIVESVKGDASVRSPLKPGKNPTFRGIVVQVWILRLKRAKMPFSADLYPGNGIFVFFGDICN